MISKKRTKEGFIKQKFWSFWVQIGQSRGALVLLDPGQTVPWIPNLMKPINSKDHATKG